MTYESAADTGTRFIEVRLTGKGLTLLNSIPDALKEKTTFRQRIGKALKGSSKEALKSAMNHLIKAAVSGQFDLPG